MTNCFLIFLLSTNDKCGLWYNGEIVAAKILILILLTMYSRSEQLFQHFWQHVCMYDEYVCMHEYYMCNVYGCISPRDLRYYTE